MKKSVKKLKGAISKREVELKGLTKSSFYIGSSAMIACGINRDRLLRIKEEIRGLELAVNVLEA